MIHRTPTTDAYWERFKEALARYVIHGTIPGHFLTAILENDLREAIFRADPASAGILKALVQLVFNDLPDIAVGSREAVQKWSEEKHRDVRADWEFRIRSAVLTNYDHEASS